MGMQCTFSFAELSERHGCVVTYDDLSGCATVVVRLPNNQGDLFFGGVFVDAENEAVESPFCWFDCGRFDATRQAMFRFLIENRICFAVR